MTLRRRATAACAALALLAGTALAGTALAAPVGTDHSCPASVPSAGFADVSPTYPHARPIDCLVWWDIASGKTVSSYAPQDGVTRGQMATFLVHLLQRGGYAVDSTAAPEAFTDTGADSHHADINTLADAGVTGGYSDGTFRPARTVTRAQMATFLRRAYDLLALQPMPDGPVAFGDVAGDAHLADIDKLAALGVTGGTSAATFSPGQPVSRGQMASFLVRLLDLLVVDGDSLLPLDRTPMTPPTTTSDTTAVRSLRGGTYAATFTFSGSACTDPFVLADIISFSVVPLPSPTEGMTGTASVHLGAGYWIVGSTASGTPDCSIALSLQRTGA